ncbi:hypothetical protein FKM82_009465 [Ascaphus truei]
MEPRSAAFVSVCGSWGPKPLKGGMVCSGLMNQSTAGIRSYKSNGLYFVCTSWVNRAMFSMSRAKGYELVHCSASLKWRGLIFPGAWAPLQPPTINLACSHHLSLSRY